MHVQKSSSCGCKCRMEVGVKVGLPMRFFFLFFFFFIFMFSFFPSCQQCLQLACLPLYITIMEINKNITIISILKHCSLSTLRKSWIIFATSMEKIYSQIN
jgi:hypothetical protein